MAYRNKTYVIFDGDNDMWAYGYMRGWKSNENVDFNFYDAHDLKPLTDRASDETIYRRLRERFSNAKQVIVLVGENTRNLRKFVRWEIEIAFDLGLPVIAVNLSGSRQIDLERCPPILQQEYVVHVPFRAAIIQHALDQFPGEHVMRCYQVRGGHNSDRPHEWELLSVSKIEQLAKTGLRFTDPRPDYKRGDKAMATIY